MIAPNLLFVPAELRAVPHWVNWKLEQRPDRTTGELKWTKPPYQPNGQHAESDNPSTWTTFEQAVAAYEKGKFSGIGFVVTHDDDLSGVDLDHCRNPETGVIEPWAMKIVQALNSYTEISPSGTGLRIFLRAKLPPKDRKIGNFECYESGRYLTVTGNHLEGTPTTIEHRQAEMEAVHAEMFAERNKPRGNGKVNTPSVLPNLNDKDLLDKAFNAKNGGDVWRLFHGDISGYPSQSEAELALCSRLGFYTGADPQKLDRLIRASDLYRPKWDDQRGGSTYGQLTISKALEGDREFYSPNEHGSDNGYQPDHNSLNSYSSNDMQWPDAPAPEAFYGLAGDVVEAISPHTEADPVALLDTFLGYFGNAIGRTAHAVAEADRHGTNLFAVLVGETARGRKGSSAGHIQELFRRVDSEWASTRIMGGLSSGEGLIWAARDPITKTEPIKEKGRHTGEYQTIEVDPGVSDKRLLVYESEFAGVLRVIARETNTLSALIRQAWDRGDLRTLTKNSPAKATGAHISIIGHITKDELLRYLDDVETGNGFANRFLWLCVRRSQMLPEGGGTPDYNSLTKVLHDTLEGARHLDRIGRDDQTREVWAEIYPELSEGKGGMYGAITARAEAQVLRLSALYAALDVSEYIRLPHLKAAIALWQYAEASARYIFGNATGDPIADRILEALPHGELTRTAMSHMFQRNVSAERIDLALRLLHRTKRAVMERRETNGRPVEVWSLA